MRGAESYNAGMDDGRTVAPRGEVLAEIADAAADAVSLLRRVVTMPRMQPKAVSVYRVKVDAAKALLHVSGYMAHANRAPADRAATLADLSADDLRQLVERTESELANRARQVAAPPAIDRAGAVDLEPAGESDGAGLDASRAAPDAEIEAETGAGAQGDAPSAPRTARKAADILG